MKIFLKLLTIIFFLTLQVIPTHAAPPPDTTPPLIFDSAATVTEDYVEIYWETDEPADSLVEYGLGKTYGSRTQTIDDLTLIHTIRIPTTLLLSNTQYHFRIRSSNLLELESISPDGTFTTLSAELAPDTTPPTVSIVSPQAGSTLDIASMIDIIASVNDPDVPGQTKSGIAGVQFKLNDQNLGNEDVTPPQYLFVWEPRTLEEGEYTLTAVARDTAGNTRASSPISITLFAFNNKTPVLDHIGNMTVEEGNTLNIELSGQDEDMDVLTFSATNIPTNAIFNPPTRRFIFNPSYSDAGTYVVTFTLSDGNIRGTTSETVTITVLNKNRAPIANAGTDQSIASGGRATLNALSSSDPDNDTLRYFWAQKSGPQITLPTPLLGSIPMQFVTGGVYEFEVTVTDGALISKDRVFVYVNQPVPVQVTPPPGAGNPPSGLFPEVPGGAPPNNTYVLPYQNQIDTFSGTGATSSVRNLILGASGSEVKRLQQVLNQKGYIVSATGAGSRGRESTFFGNATLIALKKYQCQIMRRCSGGLYGVLDNETRASLGMTGTVLVPTIPAPGSSSKFTRTLSLGSTGNDVKALQVFLNSHGFIVATSGPGSRGKETTKFGPGTKRALIKFQEYYRSEILTPNRLTKGTGVFGKSTRTKVIQLLSL